MKGVGSEPCGYLMEECSRHWRQLAQSLEGRSMVCVFSVLVRALCLSWFKFTLPGTLSLLSLPFQPPTLETATWLTKPLVMNPYTLVRLFLFIHIPFAFRLFFSIQQSRRLHSIRCFLKVEITFFFSDYKVIYNYCFKKIQQFRQISRMGNCLSNLFVFLLLPLSNIVYTVRLFSVLIYLIHRHTFKNKNKTMLYITGFFLLNSIQWSFFFTSEYM